MGEDPGASPGPPRREGLIARLRYLTDEDFRGGIERGLRRRLPDLDLVRVQDVGLLGKDDPIVLEWA